MELMRTPRRVAIDLTSACNLRCLYCLHRSSPGETALDLPAGEWLAFLAELERDAVLEVILGGGEPMLYPDFLRIVAGIAARRLRFAVVTNGTLVTTEIASALAATGRCDLAQVSLDSATPAAHDAVRGEGSHALALRGLRLLQAAGLRTTARITIGRPNLPSLEETAVFLLEDLGLPYISVNSVDYLGLCRENAGELQLDPAERARAMEILLVLDRRYAGRIAALAGPLAEARRWPTMARARLEDQTGPPGGGHLSGCGCPWSSLSVRADGVIVPCGLLSGIELGRINRDSLAGIWTDHPELKRLRDRGRIPLAGLAGCRDCPYIPYCTGDCPGVGYNRTGEIDAPNPDSCLRRYLAAGGRLPEV